MKIKVSDKESSQSPEKLNDLAEFFKVFADFTRLRIIQLLNDEELPVGEIARRLEMEQSAISHQLRVLKAARLVKQRREGKSIFYSLDDSHVSQVFHQGLEHVNH